MLTPERLSQQLRAWSAGLLPKSSQLGPSPILFYQRLFALVHELRSSVGLSADPDLTALQPVISNIDTLLRPLAYDEHELPPESNARVRDLASFLGPLDTLAPLAALLLAERTNAIASKGALPPALEKVIDQPSSWDSLARGRARSCARHGYTFLVRDDTVLLEELKVVDARHETDMARLGGLVVARKLDVPKAPASGPPASGSGSGPGPVTIELRTLAAIRPGAPAPGGDWTPVALT